MCSRSLFSCGHAFALAASLLAASTAVGAEEEKKPETIVTVAVAKVIRTTLRAYVTAYGNVETAPAGGTNQPAGGARLTAPVSGFVVAVPGTEGAAVAPGAVLVQLDARAAEAAVAKARATLTAAEKARARQSKLQAVDGTSERAWQEAEERFAAAQSELAAANFQQSLLTIRAPLAGTLTRLRVKPGEWLEAAKEIGEIVDANQLVVALQVPAAETAHLRAGQRAQVFARLGELEKPLAEATVQFVSSQITAGTDSVGVRLALPPGSGLRAGQFVAARVVVDERADRLAVPRAAVYTDQEGQSTLSIVEGDVAKQKTVKIGLRDGALVEIEGEGLRAGATVVTQGSYALPKETKVRILPLPQEAK